MFGTPRTPAFLAGLQGPEAAVRPAPFAAGGATATPRPALRHGPPGHEAAAPAGPTPEQLAAIRAEAMQKVAHAVEVLRLQAERLAEQARADALEIGFRVARRILEAELSTSPDAFFSLVRSALQRAGDSRKVSVRVHPQDAKTLAPALAAGTLGVAAATVEVLPDAGLAPGDCIVDTDFGKVDGRLDTRLEELHRAAVAAAEEGG
ncbi:MAG TPA: FliH/SctL family protein [Anaeromyxobacter sp.]|nr:FliH/SctL family protein [Anaeromyxobacter sp.]